MYFYLSKICGIATFTWIKNLNISSFEWIYECMNDIPISPEADISSQSHCLFSNLRWNPSDGQRSQSCWMTWEKLQRRLNHHHNLIWPQVEWSVWEPHLFSIRRRGSEIIWHCLDRKLDSVWETPDQVFSPLWHHFLPPLHNTWPWWTLSSLRWCRYTVLDVVLMSGGNCCDFLWTLCFDTLVYILIVRLIGASIQYVLFLATSYLTKMLPCLPFSDPPVLCEWFVLEPMRQMFKSVDVFSASYVNMPVPFDSTGQDSGSMLLQQEIVFVDCSLPGL